MLLQPHDQNLDYIYIYEENYYLDTTGITYNVTIFFKPHNITYNYGAS